jgi:hypothetical protein
MNEIINDNTCKTEESNIISFDTLVISGASSKCIIILGALQYLYDQNYLNNIDNFTGTSAGAIVCFLLIIGYTPIEIIVYICTNQLIEKMAHFNVVAMINGHGASSFSNIYEQLEKMTIAKIGYIPIDVCHLYHGSLKNRSYMDRHQAILNHAYDPQTDIKLVNDVYEWATDKTEMHKMIKDYFYSRMEDDE